MAMIIVALCVLVAGLAVVGHAEDETDRSAEREVAVSLSELEERVQKAASEAIPSVVAIRELMTGNSLGSGVIISADGLVLSQYHVTHTSDASNRNGTRKPGDHVEVILADGRKCKGKLLGADRTYELSLLRIVDLKGTLPFASLDENVTVEAGDRVLKLGHPHGYRPSRGPVVRLGRVLCAQRYLFATDCLVASGDSGGPFFNLDGRLVGIVHAQTLPEQITNRQASSAAIVNAATTSALITSRLASMLNAEVSTPDAKQVFENFRATREVLPDHRWSQGATSRAAYVDAAGQAKSSVVALRDQQDVRALGTIVESGGLIVTKASALPAEPRCELPTGEIVAAEVLGMEATFDVALLKIAADDLRAVSWRDEPLQAAGTFIYAPGLQRLPLATGVVSVPTREQKGPFPSQVKPPPKRPAALPEVIGSSVQGRGYWVEYVDGQAAAAGIRPGDVLLTIGDVAIRRHQDLVACVEGHFAGDRLKVRLLRAARTHELTLRLRAEGVSQYSSQRKAFPVVFEHDAPLFPHECGGPLLDLDGNTVGITMARIGDHGCIAIPSESIRALLPDLKARSYLENWRAYQHIVARRDNAATTAEEPAEVGEPVSLTLDELKKKLQDRRERIQSLVVDYDVVMEAHLHPELLMSWNLQLVRDYHEAHRMGFSGEKRLSQVISPGLLIWNAPRDRVEPDSHAPPSVIETVERQRQDAVRSKEEGRSDHLHSRLREKQKNRYVFDGNKCFRWDSLRKQMVPTPTNRFHFGDLYLRGLGLRPLDPEPNSKHLRDQRLVSFSENFACYDECRVQPEHRMVGDAACIATEAKYHTIQDGVDVERVDEIWLDPEVGFTPRRWERRVNGVISELRTNSQFEEFAPECWLPWESTWTFYTPQWVAPDLRNQPAYSFSVRLRKSRVNDISNDVFKP